MQLDLHLAFVLFRYDPFSARVRHAGPEDVHKVVPGTGRGGGRMSTNDQAVRVVRQDSGGAQEQFGQGPSLLDRERCDLAGAADVHVKNLISEDGGVGRTGAGGEKAGQAAAADGVQQGQRSRIGIDRNCA